MSNEYYTPTGTPATGAAGSSAPVRAEFNEIEDGFDLMPALSGNGGKAVIINSGGTAMTVTTGTLALAGNFATTGAYNTSITQQASITLTLPAVSGTVATLAGTETLSNKTLVAPALGTPASGVLTNCTGTAAGLTAGNVTTNANLTGPITSVGNTTSVGAQTGTGSTFVMQASPTLTTPVLGVATATSLAIGGATLGSNALAITGHVLVEGVTSTGATGTGDFVFATAPTVTTLTVSSGTTAVQALTATTGVFSSTLASGALTVTGLATVTRAETNSQISLSRTGTFPGSGYLGANQFRPFIVAATDGGTELFGVPSAGGFVATGNSTVTGTLGVTGTTTLGTGSTDWWSLAGGSGSVSMRPAGASANIGAYFSSKGAADVFLQTNTNGATQLQIAHTASPNQNAIITGGNGVSPRIYASGASDIAVGASQWTFAEANSVSPTSPNRTLTVTIGGTTYYIHAKTTND